MPFLLIIGVIVSIGIIIIRIIFTNTQEIFPGGSILLDQVLFNLVLAYIASFIFYLITIYFPRKRNVRNINEYIKKQTNLIIINSTNLIEHLSDSTNSDINWEEIDEGKANKICHGINPHSNAPMVIGYQRRKKANYAEYIYHNKTIIVKLINKIFRYLIFLDTKYISILNKMLDSGYFSQCDIFLKNINAFNNSNLSTMGNDLFEYIGLIKELKQYKDKYLS